MKQTRRLALAGTFLGLLLALPAPAAAHTGGAASGLLHGLGHPVLGWDHLLAMVAVGLLAAQRGGRALWALPVAFVAAMAFGGVLGMSGVTVPGVELMIVGSVVALGGLVALAARFPLAAASVAVAGFALFHGHAHGTEAPLAASGLFYGLGFLASTAVLHAAGIAAVRLARAGAATRNPVWVRTAGAAISFAGLALWLVV